MLKMVVFPAPLGPIRAMMPPAGMSNDAPDTAFRPRNDLEMFSALSMQLQFLREPGPNSVRQEHDHRQQHHAVEHLLDAGDLDAEPGKRLRDAVGKERQRRRAEDR